MGRKGEEEEASPVVIVVVISILEARHGHLIYQRNPSTLQSSHG
jgi:hypothetical protein